MKTELFRGAIAIVSVCSIVFPEGVTDALAFFRYLNLNTCSSFHDLNLTKQNIVASSLKRMKVMSTRVNARVPS